MLLVAIDPGLRGCGVSAWQDGQLLFATYVESDEATDRGAEAFRAMARAVQAVHPLVPDVLLVEEMQADGRTFGNRTVSILLVQAVTGALIGIYSDAPEVVSVKPSGWKGNKSKDATREDAQVTLSAEELSNVDLPRAKDLAHNVWDSVALALWFLRKRGLRNDDEGGGDEVVDQAL
jgi:hypothetical protein